MMPFHKFFLTSLIPKIIIYLKAVRRTGRPRLPFSPLSIDRGADLVAGLGVDRDSFAAGPVVQGSRRVAGPGPFPDAHPAFFAAAAPCAPLAPLTGY